MTRPSPRSFFAGCALIAAPAVAHAAGEAPFVSAAPSDARREVVLALGYGSIIAPRTIAVYGGVDKAESVAALEGISVDVTRRLPTFEYGARFWRMGDSSDGRGANAHVLTRWTTEVRLYPWRFRTVEPWVGGELGLALADDFALWDKTDKEPAHRALAGVRPALAAGLEAGARFHLAPLLAIGLRGGLLFLGFEPGAGPVAESPVASKYLVHPTDYARRAWLSIALSAELTVPD